MESRAISELVTHLEHSVMICHSYNDIYRNIYLEFRYSCLLLPLSNLLLFHAFPGFFAAKSLWNLEIIAVF